MKFAALALVGVAVLHGEEGTSRTGTAQELLRQGILATKLEGCRAALPLLTQAVQEDARSAEGWHWVGMCQGRLGQRDEKVKAMAAAVRLRPGSVESRHQLILALLLAGQSAKALEEVSALRTLDEGLASRLGRLVQEACDAKPVRQEATRIASR